MPSAHAARSKASAPRLQLQLLHNPRLVDGARELALADKDAALLAVLALDGASPRADVALLLWPGAAGADTAAAARRAANNLRQRIFRLNRWAACEVVVQGRTLALGAAVRHDLVLDDAALLADEMPRGELLGHHAYAEPALAAWADAARQRWRSQRADRVLGAVTRLEAESRLGEAVRLATRLVADEPLLEHAARILMRLHHRRGDRGAAQAEYERLRKALYDDCGEPPADETVELAVAIARSDVPGVRPAATLPLALRHPPRTVGRDALIGAAEARWQLGAQLLLLGAAGIGKTRLLSDLVRRWALPLVVQLAPPCAESSYGLLSQLAGALRKYAVNAGAVLEGWLAWLEAPAERTSPLQPVSRAKLVEVVAALVASAGAGGCRGVAIEDLHYADAASLDVLCDVWAATAAAALRGDAAPRFGWLASARDNELPAAVGRWLDALPPDADPALRLKPLERTATRELLATIGLGDAWLDAAAERLHRHCGGHPLFMLQVLRQLQLSGDLERIDRLAQLPLPEEAMSSASQRLTRAEPAAQQMAFLAALCGGDFTAALMCRLMDCAATALLPPWHRLEDLHVFGAHGFAHDLVREAVLAAVPRALVPLLHRDIAAALQELGADAQRVAGHWEAAGEAAQAARAYDRAAQGARACGLEGRAIELLERAARLYRQAGQGDEAFGCAWRAGHLRVGYGSARDALEVGTRLGAEAAGARQRALAAELRACALVALHDERALAEAEAAMALATPLDDAGLAAQCRMRMGTVRAVLGCHEQALVDLQAVAGELQHLDDDARHDLEGDLSSVLASLGRREEALARWQASLGDALASRHIARASFAAGSCATHLSYLGRLGEAVAMAERAVALAREAGVADGSILIDEMGLAGNLADLGRFDEALALGERALRELQRGGMQAWAMNAANDRAVIYMRLGRYDLAQRLLGEEAQAEVPVWVRAARRLTRAKLDEWRGRDAAAAMAEAAALFEAGGAVLDSYAGRKIALARARLAGAPLALEAARQTAQWASRHQYVAFVRQAQMVEVEALTRLARHAEAADTATRLLQIETLADQCFGIYWPELLEVLADALAAAGQAAPAQAARRRGAAWISNCAAQHIQPPLREAFLTRNPINARLLRHAAGAERTR